MKNLFIEMWKRNKLVCLIKKIIRKKRLFDLYECKTYIEQYEGMANKYKKKAKSLQMLDDMYYSNTNSLQIEEYMVLYYKALYYKSTWVKKSVKLRLKLYPDRKIIPFPKKNQE